MRKTLKGALKFIFAIFFSLAILLYPQCMTLKVLADNNPDVQSLINAGVSKENQGDYAGAEAYYRNLINTYPGNQEIMYFSYNRLGSCYSITHNAAGMDSMAAEFSQKYNPNDYYVECSFESGNPMKLFVSSFNVPVIIDKSGLSSTQLSETLAALNEWTLASNNQLKFIVSYGTCPSSFNGSSNAIYIKGTSDASGSGNGLTFGVGTYNFQSSVTVKNTLSDSGFYAAMLHEIGHGIGLNHSFNRNDIMNFGGNYIGNGHLSQRDINTLRKYCRLISGNVNYICFIINDVCNTHSQSELDHATAILKSSNLQSYDPDLAAYYTSEIAFDQQNYCGSQRNSSSSSTSSTSSTSSAAANSTTPSSSAVSQSHSPAPKIPSTANGSLASQSNSPVPQLPSGNVPPAGAVAANSDNNAPLQAAKADNSYLVNLDSSYISRLSDNSILTAKLDDISVEIPASVLKKNIGSGSFKLTVTIPSDSEISKVGKNLQTIDAFDINLENTLNGTLIHQLGGSVKIKVNLTDDMAKQISQYNAKLYYYDKDTGALEEMNAVFNLTDKTAAFTTSHFSYFIIGRPHDVPKNSKHSYTMMIIIIGISLTALCAAASFVVLQRKKRAKLNLK